MSRDGGIVYPLSWLAEPSGPLDPGQCRTRLYPPSRNTHVYSRALPAHLQASVSWCRLEVGSRRVFLPDLEVRFPSCHGLGIRFLVTKGEGKARQELILMAVRKERMRHPELPVTHTATGGQSPREHPPSGRKGE